MKHKIMSIDLDGTLLTKTKKITTKDKLALSNYMAKGNIAFINTGRPNVSAELFMNEINDFAQIKMPYLSCFNGAYIKDFKTNKIYETLIKQNLAKKIYDLIIKNNLQGWFYTKGSLKQKSVEATNKHNTLIRFFIKKFKAINLINIQDISNLVSYKINVFSNNHKKLSAFYQEIQKKFKDLLTLSFTSQSIVEITCKGIDKGYAIEKICQLEKLNKDNVVAIGDSWNDLAAFKASNLPIAIKPSDKKLTEYVKVVIYTKRSAINEVITNIVNNQSEINSYIKLIASDLDGTLLDQKTKKIAFETKVAIQTACNDYLIPLVIASGRDVYDCLKVLKTLELSKEVKTFVVANNGAMIYDVKKQEYIAINQIDYQVAQEVFDYIKNENDHNNQRIGLLLYRKKAEVGHYNMKSGMYLNDPWRDSPLVEYKQLNQDKYNKIIASFDDDKLATKYLKILRHKFKNLEFSQSANTNIEITAKAINKGFGIKKICNYLKINPKQTMIFGDQTNDIPMLQLTNYSFCPIKSSKKVKSIAKHIIENDDSKFVADAINTFLLNKIEVKGNDQ